VVKVGATTTKSLSHGIQFCKIDEVGTEYHYHGPFGGLGAYNCEGLGVTCEFHDGNHLKTHCITNPGLPAKPKRLFIQYFVLKFEHNTGLDS
jgi:hypothetical protein